MCGRSIGSVGQSSSDKSSTEIATAPLSTPSAESLKEVKAEAKQRAKLEKERLASKSQWQKNVRKSKARASRRRFRRSFSRLLSGLFKFALLSAILTAFINPTFRTQALNQFELLKNKAQSSTANITGSITITSGVGSGCLKSMQLTAIDPLSSEDPTKQLLKAAKESQKSAVSSGYEEYIDVKDASLFGDYGTLTPRRIVIAKNAGKRTKMGSFEGINPSVSSAMSGDSTAAMYDIILSNFDSSTLVTQESDGTLRIGQAGTLFGLGPDNIFRFAVSSGRISAWCQESSDGGEHNHGWAYYSLDELGQNIADMVGKDGHKIKTDGFLGGSELRASDMKKLDGSDITSVFPINFGQSQVLAINDCPLFITPDASAQDAVIKGMAKFSDFDAVTGNNYVLIDSSQMGNFGCAKQFAAQIGGSIQHYSWE